MNKIHISFCVISFTIIISLIFAIPFRVLAENYGQSFVETIGPGYTSTAGRSPNRDGSNNDLWPNIGSKSNQPRNVVIGTNPHQGTDLSMSAGTAVYPVYAGTVTYIDRDVSDQKGNVRIQSYDTSLGTFYMEYMHIVPSAAISVGSTVTVNTNIGLVDSQKVYSPHLHFGRVNSNSTLQYKMTWLFRWVSNWKYGCDLEFIANDQIDFANNIFYATAYSLGTSHTRTALTSLNFYFKIGSSGTWSPTPISMTLSDPANFQYSINLRYATGAAPGQIVYYYIAGIRNFSYAYKHGLYPQFYTQPGLPLSSSYANAIARSYAIVG